MSSLFRVFTNYIIKVTLIYMFGALAAVLLLDRLFGGYEFYLGMLVFIGPLVAWGMTFVLVPKNLDWIMALPISKRDILLLHYGTSVFSAVVMTLATVFDLLALTLIKSDIHLRNIHFGGIHARADQLARAAPAVASTPAHSIWGAVDIYGWMLALLMLSFFHALSISISRPRATKSLYVSLWSHHQKWLRWTVRLGWVAAIALAATLREFFLSPFGIFTVATITFLLITTLNTSHALGVARAQRNRWLALGATLAVAQIAFLFTYATGGVRAASFDRRVASVMFLGPLSGGLARADLAHLLEGDLSVERIKDLGELYRGRFANGKLLDAAAASSGVDFTRAIASKRTYRDVMAVADLFDPATLAGPQLSTLLAKVGPLVGQCHCEFPYARFLPARLAPDDALALQASSNELASRFGLLYGRYHRQAAMIPVISHAMPRYSDELKLEALRTLSVLEGRHLTLNDWLRLARGRGLSSDFFQVDCQGWPGRAVTGLLSRDAAALNVCVRSRLEPGLVPELEAAGWLAPPLTPGQAQLVRRALRARP